MTLVLVNPKQVHLVAGSTTISSLWKRCVWSIEHNHYLPVKSSRVQPQLFSPTLYSLTFWLISNPSPVLSSLLSDPLLFHLLVDLQPSSGNLLSDDIRTIPCRRSYPMISARFHADAPLPDDPRATTPVLRDIHHEITSQML